MANATVETLVMKKDEYDDTSSDNMMRASDFDALTKSEKSELDSVLVDAV